MAHNILYFLKIDFILLELLFFRYFGYSINEPTSVTGWVISFPLRDGFRRIYLDWDAIPGAIEYRVYRSSFPKGDPPPTLPPSATDISPDIVTVTALTDANLRSNHWYIYQVTAFDGTTESTASPEKSYGIFVPRVRLKWEEIP